MTETAIQPAASVGGGPSFWLVLYLTNRHETAGVRPSIGRGSRAQTGRLRRDRLTPVPNNCSHIEALGAASHPHARACAECVKIGARWVHLRTCQSCGATLCCDSSPNRHARTHAQGSDHPVFASAEQEERWLYCFVDDTFVEY